MVKTAIISLATLVFSFVMAGIIVSQASAQSPTVTETASPTTTPAVSPRVPDGAPATGFGGGN